MHPKSTALLFCALLSGFSLHAHAQAPMSEGTLVPEEARIDKPADATKNFNLRLLPTSFQKDPNTDITLICEMTEDGAKRPVVTKQSPATYVAVDAGYKDLGQSESLRRPEPQILQETLQRALLHNGYQPASKERPADYVLIMHWGSFTRNTGNETMGDIFNRALLIGGQKFAQRLAKVMREEMDQKQGNNTLQQDEEGRVIITSDNEPARAMRFATTHSAFTEEQLGMSTDSTGAAVNNMMQALSPMERFMRNSERDRFLLQQATSNVFYVVVSAYDPAELSAGSKKLLWRARMSINADGLSLSDALPNLISHSGTYLGRHMEEPATMTPRLLKQKASVNIGEAEVIEEPASTKAE